VVNSLVYKMNKKGEEGGLVWENVTYLILLVMFLAGMLYFVMGYVDGVAVWEKYYAAELARVIDIAEPGDEIQIDVHTGTRIALKNGVAFSDIFYFDNADNSVHIRLRPRGSTVYHYFSDVDVVEWEIEQGIETGVNVLKFKIKDAGGGG